MTEKQETKAIVIAQVGDKEIKNSDFALFLQSIVKSFNKFIYRISIHSFINGAQK